MSEEEETFQKPKLVLEQQSFVSFPLTQILEKSSYEHLASLNLSRNQLHSVCSPEELSKFTNLKKLSLNYNNFVSLSNGFALQPLYSQLTVLRMAGNLLTEWPWCKGVAGEIPLRKLEIGLNCLSSIPGDFFQAAVNLEELTCAYNNLTTLPPQIRNLSSLTSLFIYDNGLQTLPPEFGSLTSLNRARLDSNSLSSLPSTISNLQSLSLLDLGSNKLSSLPSEFSELSSLIFLVLSSNRLSSIPPSFFSPSTGLSSLQKLFLNNNALTSQTFPFSELCDSLVQLRELHIHNNLIAEIPPNISNLGYLTVLNLASNKLSTLPSELFSLQYLKKLNLAGNLLVYLPDELGYLASLTSLNVGYNLLTVLPSSISSLCLLQDLFVSGNQLEFLIPYPGAFLTLTHLQLIHCSHNLLTEVPHESEFGSDNLAVFDLSYNRLPSDAESTLSDWWKWFKTYRYLLLTPTRDSDSEIDAQAITTAPSSPIPYRFGYSETQGRRSNMEDTVQQHLNLPSFKDQYSALPKSEAGHMNKLSFPVINRAAKSSSSSDLLANGQELRTQNAYFGVFDGHGGLATAEYLRDNLHDALKEKLLEFAQSKKGQQEEQICDCLRVTFKTVNEQLLAASHTPTDPYPVGASGSTAAVVLLMDGVIYSANCGDARSVLSRGRKALRLSVDHKPQLVEERKRVLSQGGYVDIYGRINDYIAVSRAFGDFGLSHLVSVNPDIHYFPILKEDQFIILACDGVWDVMDDQTAVDIVYSCHTAKEAATKLRDYAFIFGSTDNISVVVVFLPGYLPNPSDATCERFFVSPGTLSADLLELNISENQSDVFLEEEQDNLEDNEPEVEIEQEVEVEQVEFTEQEEVAEEPEESVEEVVEEVQELIEEHHLEEEKEAREARLRQEQKERERREEEQRIQKEREKLQKEAEEKKRIESENRRKEEEKKKEQERKQQEERKRKEEAERKRKEEAEKKKKEEEEKKRKEELEKKKAKQSSTTSVHQPAVTGSSPTSPTPTIDEQPKQGSVASRVAALATSGTSSSPNLVGGRGKLGVGTKIGSTQSDGSSPSSAPNLAGKVGAGPKVGSSSSGGFGKSPASTTTTTTTTTSSTGGRFGSPAGGAGNKFGSSAASTTTTTSGSRFGSPAGSSSVNAIAPVTTGSRFGPGRSTPSGGSGSGIFKKMNSQNADLRVEEPKMRPGDDQLLALLADRKSGFYSTPKYIQSLGLSDARTARAIEAFKSHCSANFTLGSDAFFNILKDNPQIGKGLSDQMMKRMSGMWFSSADKYQRGVISFEEFLSISAKEKFF